MTELIESIAAGEDAFGERLLPLGSGPVPVAGSRSGTLALTPDGAAVLIVVLDALAPEAAVDIADHLDRLSRYSEKDLAALRTDPSADGDLKEWHESHFGVAAPPLNRRQRAVVIVDERPPTEAWKALVVELGSQLAGVFNVKNGVPRRLELPEELRPRTGRLTPSMLVLIALLLICATVVVVALNRPDPAPPVSASAVWTVAVDTEGAATNSQWVGQQRMVRTSQGSLIVVYTSGADLQVVSDFANQGRSWSVPVTAREIDAAAVSVAIDGSDRLHLAYSDGESIKYALLSNNGRTWKRGPILDLDARTTSLTVDIAWDEVLQVAHVVWSREVDGANQPRWATVSVTGDTPQVDRSGALAPAGRDSTVLVNVAADPGRGALVTYRKGDPIYGWFSRVATVRTGQDKLEWQKEEEVSTEQFIGATDLAIDRSGTAHLVLRDSVGFQLLYSQKPRGEPWSAPEVVVDAEAIEAIDFPTLSVDRVTQLVYVFFQSNEFYDQNEIRAVVRDPAVGWTSGFSVASKRENADGSAFPSTMGTTSGPPLILWTTTVGSPAIQIANVVAP